MHGAPGTRAGASGGPGRGVSAHARPPHPPPTGCAAASPSSGLVAAPAGAALRRFLPAFMSRRMGTPA